MFGQCFPMHLKAVEEVSLVGPINSCSAGKYQHQVYNAAFRTT